MNKTLLVIGIIILALGIFANVFSVTTPQSHLFGLYSTSSSSNPYSIYSVPLLIGGIVLIIVGAVMKEGKK